MDWIEITTLTQLFFHLKNGEVVICPIADADIYLHAEEDCYRIIMQRPFRSAVEATGGQEQVEKLFAELKRSGVHIWVLPGGELRGVNGFWPRLIDGFRHLFAHWFFG